MSTTTYPKTVYRVYNLDTNKYVLTHSGISIYESRNLAKKAAKELGDKYEVHKFELQRVKM